MKADSKAIAKPLANASQTQWQNDAPSPPPIPLDDNSLRSLSSPPSIPPGDSVGTASPPVRGRPSICELEGFDAFWAAYPPEARTAPDYARKSYAKALQLGATPESILGALRRDLERAGKRAPLAPAAWLKGGSWRLEDDVQSPPARGNIAPIDPRFDGWEPADHMVLRQWQSARESHWLTRDPRRNAMPEDARRLDLWSDIERNRPRVARFLAQHEPDGVPLEEAA